MKHHVTLDGRIIDAESGMEARRKMITVISWTASEQMIREVAAHNHLDAWDAALKEFEHPRCHKVEINDGRGTIYSVTTRDVGSKWS